MPRHRHQGRPHLVRGDGDPRGIIGCRSASCRRSCHPQMTHSSSSSCSCVRLQQASCSAAAPRWETSEPVWPGRYWLKPSVIARKVRSTFPFAGPFAGGTGRLHRHSQALARGDKRGRHVHPSLVHHHRLRHDHRPGSRLLQPRVQRDQPLIGDDGPLHGQGRVPARPHRRRHHHLSQQHRRVHRRRAHRTHHRGADAARRHVQRDAQLKTASHTVVQYRQDIQRCAVQHHQLARPQCHRRRERRRRPRCMPPPLRRCPQQSLSVGHRVHQPVERRHRRQSHHPRAVLLLQQPPPPAAQPHQCARRPLPLLLQHRPDCRDHSLIGPPHRRPLPHRPAVHQPPQALAAVARPHPAPSPHSPTSPPPSTPQPSPAPAAPGFVSPDRTAHAGSPARPRPGSRSPTSRTCRCHARARSRT